MKRIYMILQYGSIKEIESLYQEQFVYYADDDLLDIERKIKNNYTDLYEAGSYPYVVLKTIDLCTIGATNEPLRIFEYQKDDNIYKEIGYLKLLTSSHEPEGIHYY